MLGVVIIIVQDSRTPEKLKVGRVFTILVMNTIKYVCAVTNQKQILHAFDFLFHSFQFRIKWSYHHAILLRYLDKKSASINSFFSGFYPYFDIITFSTTKLRIITFDLRFMKI